MDFKFYSRKTFAFLASFASSALLMAQTTVVDLTAATGTWTVPAGVTQLTVECWGGGGGGGHSNIGSFTGRACAGGGGGAYAKKTIQVTPGQIMNFNVGRGGSGGNTSTNKDGGDTWFSGTSIVLAKGGKGTPTNSVLASLGGDALASVGDVVFDGGNGGPGSEGGDTKDAGGGGGAAGTTAKGMNGGPGSGDNSTAGTNGYRMGGNAGAGYPFTGSNNGRGGNGTDNDGSGSGASNYGAGGGGGKRGTWSAINRDGGNGSQGVIRISYCLAPDLNGSISGTTSICENASQVYSVLNIPNATYNWSLPTGWSGTSTSNTITAVAGATGGNMTVSATTSCGTSIATLSVALTSLGVTDVPSAITGQINICAGSANQIYSVQNDPSAVDYTWILPSGWTGTSTTNSISVTPDNTSGTVTVMSNSAHCGSSAPSVLNVNVYEVPDEPSVITGNAIVCPGNIETYSVANDTSVINYVWTLPNGWTGNTASNVMNAHVGANDGVVSVQAMNACGFSSPVDLTVKTGVPSAELLNIQSCSSVEINGITYDNSGVFVQNLTNLAGCDSVLTVDITLTKIKASFSKIGNVYTPIQVGTDIKWINCTDGTVLSTEKQFTPSEDGQYRLVVEKNGCADTSSCFSYNKIGLADNGNNISFTVYPNPASDVLNVNLKGVALTDKVLLSIVDMTGRTVVQNEISKTMENQTLSFDVSNLKAGVYFIQMAGKGMSFPTKKIVIQ